MVVFEYVKEKRGSIQHKISKSMEIYEKIMDNVMKDASAIELSLAIALAHYSISEMLAVIVCVETGLEPTDENVEKKRKHLMLARVENVEQMIKDGDIVLSKKLIYGDNNEQI